MKRCLVTGGSGFVGSALVRRLVAENHDTHLLLRTDHQPWRLRGLDRAIQKHAVDLQDSEAVRQLVLSLRPDWVFHLAAFGAYSNQVGMQRMVATNLLGTAALIDASAEVGVQAYVQTGSSSEYGYKNHAPAENDVLQPNSDYAITKAAATHYCSLKAKTLDFNAITVRLYSVFGPYEDPNRLIPTLILHGLRGLFPPLVSPATARDFVYVNDAVDAIVRIAGVSMIPRGSLYNVCSGVQRSLADVVETARRLMKIPGEPTWSTMNQRHWDTERWVGSNARIASQIGWRAEASLESGMAQTIEWLRTQPELLSFYSDRIFANRL